MVAWSRLAAARSAALANWVSDTGGADGAFAILVPAAALRTLSRVAEGGAEDGRALEGGEQGVELGNQGGQGRSGY